MREEEIKMEKRIEKIQEAMRLFSELEKIVHELKFVNNPLDLGAHGFSCSLKRELEKAKQISFLSEAETALKVRDILTSDKKVKRVGPDTFRISYPGNPFHYGSTRVEEVDSKELIRRRGSIS